MNTHDVVASRPALGGLDLAVTIINSAESDRLELVHELLQQRELSRCVHDLNTLLAVPEHRGVARRALQSIGFDA